MVQLDSHAGYMCCQHRLYQVRMARTQHIPGNLVAGSPGVGEHPGGCALQVLQVTSVGCIAVFLSYTNLVRRVSKTEIYSYLDRSVNNLSPLFSISTIQCLDIHFFQIYWVVIT